VEDVGPLDAERRELVRQVLEIASGRLVRPDVLGCVYGIELDAELPVACANEALSTLDRITSP
jgi:hypothetical protein